MYIGGVNLPNRKNPLQKASLKLNKQIIRDLIRTDEPNGMYAIALYKLRESSAAKEGLLPSMAMTGPGTMILLYGAGGGPGRGETPMRLRKHAAA